MAAAAAAAAASQWLLPLPLSVSQRISYFQFAVEKTVDRERTGWLLVRSTKKPHNNLLALFSRRRLILLSV